MVAGIALAGALALTGCAGKARVSSSSMCQAHGGTYNAGDYDIGTDYREIGT